jgi:UDP-N-acetylmuramyl pentapeptide phosphotransferase/UDP-N-acetylglucosamine-1-phosphate transferase
MNISYLENNCFLKQFIEAIVIGILTLFLGKIGFHLSMNEKERQKKYKELPHLGLVLFLTGFLLHYLIEFIGLNQWYCDKQCFNNMNIISKLNK